MTDDNQIQLVLDYFDGCNTGDLDQMKRNLADDITHYFLPRVHPPIRGADHLAKYWSKFQRVYQPVWKIDHAISSGDEVVSEWSCACILPATGEGYMFRGTEWYVIKDGLIAEIRAYYEYDENRPCELTGFPYAARGYLGLDALTD